LAIETTFNSVKLSGEDGKKFLEMIGEKTTMHVPNYVFVFGSNLAGVHGAGAALWARKHFGAKLGVAKGRTGDAYAIPTKNVTIKWTLSAQEISKYYEEFLLYAESKPKRIFFVTPFGTGLAGLSTSWFRDLVVNNYDSTPVNVTFAKECFL